MRNDWILLTTPCYPYPTLPANDSLTDATGQRFTKGDDVFTIISHTHCYANHILAQNIDAPVVALEYPRWEDFTAEVDKGYGFIGISSYPPHLDRVMEMCTYVRQRSPQTRIALGSYGGQAFEAAYDAQVRKEYVDDVIHGEGVKWLREQQGESTDRPIQQRLMPKAGGCPPFVSKFPKGNIAFLVSGLGCVGGCDFCSSTALFDRKRIELLDPEQLVDHIHQYYRVFPEISQVFVIEEDHFRQPRYMQALREHWGKNPEVVERLDWFGFGSIDWIGRFADKYGWEAIPETGIGTVFIGVESKFAGDHGYDKRSKHDAREVFNKLHSMGIRTVGAWMCGWDWHDHSNIHEDLNYFVSLKPTYQQLTRVSPFPGTPLWEKLRDEGRLNDVPWEDVHFWSGSQKNTVLEAHETLNLTEYGYDLLYQTWGPSILRRLEVQLDGYDFCTKASSPVLRRHRALLMKRQCAMIWTNLRAMDRLAPNGVVRRRVRKADERYRELLGEPTAVMESLALGIDALATVERLKGFVDPLNRHPKEEPFKRYIYDREPRGDDDVPYRIEMNEPTAKVRRQMRSGRRRELGLSLAMKATRRVRPRRGDPVIDDYLVNLLDKGWLGFGF